MNNPKNQLKKLLNKADPGSASFSEQLDTNDKLEDIKDSLQDAELPKQEITEAVTANDFVESLLTKIKGDKGDQGEKGKDGYTPVKGVDYEDGEDADEAVIVDKVIPQVVPLVVPLVLEQMPTKEEILNAIPKPKDGATGPVGPQGASIKGDKGNPGKDTSPKDVIKALKELPEKDKLDVSHLKNSAQILSAIGKYNSSDQRWHGGGTTSPLTTKGDVWGYSTTNARIPVGSNDQVLTADSTQPLGVKWANNLATGITSINTDTTTAQTLAVGTTGTDFAIVDNGTGTHTFNLPTASALNRGALSSTDWTTFNNKQPAGNYITALTGEGTASGPGSVALTLSNSAVIGKVLTGYTSGAGTVSATDTILSAIQKLNGNTAALVTGVSSVFGRTGAVVGSAADYSGVAMTGITSLNGLVITANTGVITTGTWNGTAIANANLANSSLTIGSTNIALGATSTTLAGLTSVTSTGFTGALTGHASADATVALDNLASVAMNAPLQWNNTSAQTLDIASTANTVVGRALTISAGSTVTAGTADMAGGNLTLNSGLGKGTGASSIIFQTGRTLTTGSTLQTLTTAMTILGSGNVGIGTTTPGAKLDVYSISSSNPAIQVGRDVNTNTAPIRFATGGTSDWNVGLRATSDSDFHIYSFGTSADALTILRTSGNVGIGTTAPGAKLTVSANAAALPTPLSGTTLQIGQVDGTLNRLLFDSFGAGSSGPVVSFRASGGTAASPTASLTGSGLGQIGGFGYGTTAYSSAGLVRILFTAAQDMTDSAQGTYMSFWTTANNTTSLLERMRIDNAGNVGIGTTLPGATLEVNGTAIVDGVLTSKEHTINVTSNAVTGGLILQNSAGNNPVAQFQVNYNSGAIYIGGISGAYIPIFTAGGTEALRLKTTQIVQMIGYGAGTATFDGSGNISSVSDERLKDIQGEYKVGLAEILKVNPILYKWNEKSNMETEGTYAGFSAQNVQSALGEYSVGVSPKGMLSLQDRALIAGLVNSIKELKAEIDELKNK